MERHFQKLWNKVGIPICIVPKRDGTCSKYNRNDNPERSAKICGKEEERTENIREIVKGRSVGLAINWWPITQLLIHSSLVLFFSFCPLGHSPFSPSLTSARMRNSSHYQCFIDYGSMIHHCPERNSTSFPFLVRNEERIPFHVPGFLEHAASVGLTSLI